MWLMLLLVQGISLAQGFQFLPGDRKKAVIPFDHINNLVIIPVEVNGVMLNFLLDSGVDDTIMFSLDEREVSFANLEKVFFRGLGSEQPIAGLKSGGNVLDFDGLRDEDHEIYIVLEQDLNFSSSIGMPVNGIIGYHFFRNFPVEIDYVHRKITVHSRGARNKNWKKKFTPIPIVIEGNKPYVMTGVDMGAGAFDAKMLIDVGNSDAVWLFEGGPSAITIPKNSIHDFLGRGFSGDIHGRRSRIDRISIGSFDFVQPLAAFPDTASTRNINMVPGRVGSIGGELLRRFTAVLDYGSQKLYLKRNRHFDAPFQYNMSGLDVQHEGMTWVKETVDQVQPSNLYDVNGEKILNSFTFKFELKPVYSINNVREDSPAWESGLRPGDLIKKINKKPGYRYSLEQINNLLKSGQGRELKFAIEREGKPLSFVFKLKSVL